MPITINGNGIITGASTLATPVGSPTFTTPNIDSAQFPTVSGTAPLYACRAWVNFNGTGTVAIRASGNVTSITDNGTGDYTVNFTTALPDTNYAVTFGGYNTGTGDGGWFSILGGSGGTYPTGVSTTQVRVVSYSGSGTTQDNQAFLLSIFR